MKFPLVVDIQKAMKLGSWVSEVLNRVADGAKFSVQLDCKYERKNEIFLNMDQVRVFIQTLSSKNSFLSRRNMNSDVDRMSLNIAIY